MGNAGDITNGFCSLQSRLFPAATAGATVFVAGTAVFGDPAGPTAATRHLLQLAGG